MIGEHIVVTGSKNASNIGISGKVVDETKNTIKVNDKTLIKKDITFRIKDYIVDGKLLTGTIQERIKRR